MSDPNLYTLYGLNDINRGREIRACGTQRVVLFDCPKAGVDDAVDGQDETQGENTKRIVTKFGAVNSPALAGLLNSLPSAHALDVHVVVRRGYHHLVSTYYVNSRLNGGTRDAIYLFGDAEGARAAIDVARIVANVGILQRAWMKTFDEMLNAGLRGQLEDWVFYSIARGWDTRVELLGLWTDEALPRLAPIRDPTGVGVQLEYSRSTCMFPEYPYLPDDLLTGTYFRQAGAVTLVSKLRDLFSIADPLAADEDVSEQSDSHFQAEVTSQGNAGVDSALPGARVCEARKTIEEPVVADLQPIVEQEEVRDASPFTLRGDSTADDRSTRTPAADSESAVSATPPVQHDPFSQNDEVDEPSGPDTKSTTSGVDRGGRLSLKDEARSEPIYGDLTIVTHDTVGFAERDLGIHGGLIPDEAHSQKRQPDEEFKDCAYLYSTYLDDLWYFDTQEYHWKWIEFREGERRPSPRSGFSFLPTTEGIVLYGGYCKEYAKGKRPVGIMLDDAWFLRISPVETEVAVPPIARKSSVKDATRPFTVGWGNLGMGVLFGGATYEETNEETLESVYHNDLFGYQLSGNGRWVSLALRKPKSKGKKTSGRKDRRKATDVRGACDDNNSDNDGDSDEEGKMTSADKRNQNIENVPETSMNSENSEIDPDDPMLTVPRPRYNARLAVLRNTMYICIYGGILEIGLKEFTLDDFHSLSLDKFDRYVCIKPCEIDLPKEGEIIESSSDDEEDEDDSSDDNNTEDERDDDEIKMKRSVPDEPDEDKGDEERTSKYKKWAQRQVDSAGTSESVEQSADDILSTPLPGETLAAFYARSRGYLTDKAHRTSDNRGMLLHRDGFALAQERYAMYKPTLEEVEKILAEAGLDESEIERGVAAGPRLALGESRNRR
ncbi:KEL3_2 [Sanghuangporus weigelae]